MIEWPTNKGMLAQLEMHEGRKKYPYRDTKGKITIGVGRNLSDVGVSDTEIALMLLNDVATAEAELDKHVPWWRKLDEPRQRVMLDLCFNLGFRRFSAFHATLNSCQSGDYDAAATCMAQSLWHSQVGNRADRLEKMMRTGIVPSEITYKT